MALKGKHVTAEALNTDPITAPSTDDFTLPGQLPTETIGPSATEVYGAAGMEGGVTSDPAVLEYYSTDPVQVQNIAYDQQKDAQMRHYAESLAASQSALIQQHASPEYKNTLKTILNEANKLPKPDITTTVAGERITIPASAINQPASLDREEACRLLSTFVGKDAVIEVISCARTSGSMFAVPQRGNPKAGNPVLWLSQQMALETRKHTMYDTMITKENMPFDERVDGSDQHGIVQAVARLFSIETARNVQVIARINKTNIVNVLRFLTDKICKDRRAVVNPSEDNQTEFLDIKPNISTAHSVTSIPA